MALKFAANLNFLFTETAKTITERINLAYNNGFRAVEIPFPEGETQEVAKAISETGIIVSLINISIDKNSNSLKFGSTSIPGAEELFKKQLKETIEFAKSVNCKKIHLMAGLVSTSLHNEHFKVYTSNLKLAARCLETNGMMGVIEPINKYAVPSYFMDSYEKALETLKEVNKDNIKLLVDLYHLQHICGNVTKTLEEHKNLIGHFQIAQVPNRNEPDTPGELDYAYVFEQIKAFDNNGWIGCEYKPKTTTVEGLNWIAKYGLKF